MKKIYLSALALGISFSTYAQNQATEELAEEYQEVKAVKTNFRLPQTQGKTTIWSEDFSGGIPSGWSQNGSPAIVLWEYRGPNSNPSNAVGSRGAFAGPLQSGNQGDSLNSPSTGNGFIILDSDWYHSDGDRATNGQGVAPAPHTGRLTTETIDLSGHPAIELTFHTYLRRFQAAFYIAFSKDGGLTFSDTVEIFPVTDLAVNQSSGNGDLVRVNVSNYIGDEANAAISFIFDGTLATSGGNAGRYFWMIDDIEINPLPDNVLQFTSAIAPGTSGTAPSQDIIFNGGGNPKYLHCSPRQPQNIVHDANILNYGAATQKNVRLQVSIEDATTNAVYQVLNTPAVDSLETLDTAYFTTLTTPSWTPTTPGEYHMIYRAISDSIDATTTTAVDTFMIYVGDKIALDDGVANNYFGTNTGTNGMNQVGVRFNLPAQDSTSSGMPTGKVYLKGVEIEMSALTDTTADMEFVVFDTTGFSLGSSGGFPPNATVHYNRIVPLNSSLTGGLRFFSFEDNGQPLELNPDQYFIVVVFYPNAPDGVIRIANSATWNQPGWSSVFQNMNGAWFTGFSNSDTYVAPHMRLVLADPNVSLVEEELTEFQVYPNPTRGAGTIEFSQGGFYELSLHDLKGGRMWSESRRINESENWYFDFGSVPAGLYLLHLDGNGTRRTVKLSIR